MTLSFNPISRRLVDDHNIPVTCLSLKRGDIMPVSIRVEGASSTATVGLYAKPVGDYSILPLIAVVATGNPASLTPQTNTERINTALGIGTDHELDHLDMMGEIVYSEAGKQVATATIALVLHNNVARPGLPDPAIQDDPYRGGDIPIATTAVEGKVKPDGTTITVDEDGTIKAATQSVPIATAAKAGLVRCGDNTINVTAAGDISTDAIRSLGTYKRCDVELGTGLKATVTGAERIRLDVEVTGGGTDPDKQGDFTCHNNTATTIELWEGTYEIDATIACNSYKGETNFSIKHAGTVITHLLGVINTAESGVESFAYTPHAIMINRMTDSKYATIHATVSAWNSAQGRISIEIEASEVSIISARYRRISNT